jgi:hypothetical protein
MIIIIIRIWQGTRRMLTQIAPFSEPGRAERYELVVERPAGREPTIQVFDRRHPLLHWRGPLVCHLLDSGALPADYSSSGRHCCDKWLVWHLVLAAAATQSVLDQAGYLGPTLRSIFADRRDSTLAGRRDPSAGYRTDLRIARSALLPGPHRQIARALLARPGRLFTAEELCCPVLLEYPALSRPQILECLDDLARWRVVQRSETDSGNTLYAIQA